MKLSRTLVNVLEDELPNINLRCAGLVVSTNGSATRVLFLLTLCENYVRWIST